MTAKRPRSAREAAIAGPATRRGRHPEALAELERALELDPLSVAINNALGAAHLMARRYEAALEIFQRSLDLDPDNYRTFWYLGRCQLELGRHDPAIEALNRARELSNSNPFMMAALGHAYARAGRSTEAAALVEELHAAARERYVSPAGWAMIYIGLGDRAEAFDWLNRALAERSSLLVWVKVDPLFDPLRDDPRFETLLSAVGLAGEW